MARMATPESGEWRRLVSGLFPVWAWAVVITIVGGVQIGAPMWVWGPMALVLAALACIRPPRRDDHAPVEIASPVRGRWTVVHSPASAVPSHGVRGYGQSHAVDIIHPRPEGTEPTYPWFGGFERPDGFSSFGQPVHAVADGVVVRVLDRRRDHLSRTSWAAFAYMMVIDGVRDFGGPPAVVGNHIVIDHGDDVFSLYAHVRRGSARVVVGERVAEGAVIGEVGNSGNTSEPHLHFQLMDRPKPLRAAGLPFRFRGIEQPDGAVDRGWSRGEPQAEIVNGVPANFQVFDA